MKIISIIKSNLESVSSILTGYQDNFMKVDLSKAGNIKCVLNDDLEDIDTKFVESLTSEIEGLDVGFTVLLQKNTVKLGNKTFKKTWENDNGDEIELNPALLILPVSNRDISDDITALGNSQVEVID